MSKFGSQKQNIWLLTLLGTFKLQIWSFEKGPKAKHTCIIDFEAQ
jgi:hypothetical protein